MELLSCLLESIPPERLFHHDHSQFLPSFHGGSEIEETRKNLKMNQYNKSHVTQPSITMN